MIYLEEESFGILFEIIYTHFSEKEEVPSYVNERNGIEKLLGVFQGVKQDLYPTTIEKATYYLIQINKGHFFSNGNKRIALVCSLTFLLLNGYDFNLFSKTKFEEKLRELFPSYGPYEDDIHFLPFEFAVYSLSIIIADSHTTVSSYSELKEKVVIFLNFSLVNKPFV